MFTFENIGKTIAQNKEMKQTIERLESTVENQKEIYEKNQQRIVEVEIYVGKLIDTVNATLIKDEEVKK